MKTLYKIIIMLLLLMGTAVTAEAQQGFGTSAPDKSSILDMVAADKGVLFPRVALTGLTDATTISSAANYLTVFNTATAGTSPNNVTPGYYYWNGTKWIRLLAAPDFTFQNGLADSSGYIMLGGSLTKPTTITASASNTLALTGLQSGSASTDSVIVANGANGMLKYISAYRLFSSKTTNLLTAASSKITSTVNGIVADLAPASGKIKNTLGFDSTGALVIQSPTSLTISTTNVISSSGNILTSNVNSISDTAKVVNSVSNTSSANTLLTTVNGVAGSSVPIINTNVLSNTNGKLKSTVNGVADSANVLISADNGLTSTSGNVQLGGSLTKATTIATSATNTLAISGLQTGAVTDSLVTMDANGVLHKRTAVSPTVVTKSAAYTATTSDETILVNAASSAISITLPAASAGKKYIVKKIDSSTNTVTVISTSGTIDGNASSTGVSGTLPWQGWVFQFDGTNWYIISRI